MEETDNIQDPAEETDVIKAPVKPEVMDFGKMFLDSFDKKEDTFGSLTYAQAISDMRKESPETEFNFSDDSYKAIEEKYGKKAAEGSKNMFEEAVRLSEISDLHKSFQTSRVKTLHSEANNLETAKGDTNIELPEDKVFWQGQSFTPFQHATFEQAADKNKEYYKLVDGKYQLTSLGESEDYDDVAGELNTGFNSGIVVATNDFMAKQDPEIAKKIEAGELPKDGFYVSPEGDYIYRQLDKYEETFRKSRSYMGPRTVYNENLAILARNGFQDGVLSLVDAAVYVNYMKDRGLGFLHSAIGGDTYELKTMLAQANYNDYTNWSNGLKSAGSMEEDKGWSYSFGNAVKQIANGVGQILPTMGAGLLVGGGLKGTSAVSNLTRMGAISEGWMNGLTGATTRMLNFGIAAKAAKDESRRQGLSQNESDVMSVIAGSIMLATEFLTGSQFIPKITGTAKYKEATRKLTEHMANMAKKKGVSVERLLATNPEVKRSLIAKAHAWLDADAKGVLDGFTKGFVGEGIQETTEDLGFSLVKEGYDVYTDTDSFNQEWDSDGVWHDLLGSFVMGAFSGGIIKSVSSIKGKDYKSDQIDEDRNNFFANMMVQYGYKDLEKARKELKKQGFASEILSINKDKSGRPMLLSKDKGTNSMSENEFFDRLFEEQIKFTKHAFDRLSKAKQTNQELADVMTQFMDQIEESDLSFDQVVKGTQSLMDLEGMHVFRQESLLTGHLLLEGAKAKATGDTKQSIETVEEIRVYNGKVLAIMREGDEDFSLPTVEEEALLQQVYSDVIQSNKLQDSYMAKAKGLQGIRSDMGQLEFKLERLKAANQAIPVIMQVESELEEKTAEFIEARQELVDDLKKENYSETMADTVLDLHAATEFKNQLLNGDRTERYVRNFALNLEKEKYKAIFTGRENYNIEDYDYDQRKLEYFNTENVEINEIMGKESKANAEYIDKIFETGSDPAVTTGRLMNEILDFVNDPRIVLDGETKKKVIEFFENNTIEFTPEQAKELHKEAGLILGLVDTFLTNPGEVAFTIEEDGAGAVFSKFANTIDLKKIIPKLMAYTPEQLNSVKGMINQLIIPELTDANELAIANEFANNLDQMIADVLASNGKLELFEQFSGNKNTLNDIQEFKTLNVGEDFEGYALNRNKAYADNNVPGESGIENKIEELENFDDFIDDGILDQLAQEIRTNQRFLVARISDLKNQDTSNPTTAELATIAKLSKLGQRLNALNIVSDNNRGNRFTRDFQVSLDYIQNSVSHMRAINTALGLGFEEDIKAIRVDLEVDDENKPLIHENLVALIQLEDKFSEKIQGLDNSQISELFGKLGFDDIHAKQGGLLNYAYQQVNEDNKKAFNPDSQRDQVESMLSYVLMLSRGSTQDFFTYGSDYFEDFKITEKNAPSREQLLVARQIFSKLNQEGYSNVENFVASKYGYNDKGFAQSTIFLRGIAGSGKSSRVIGVAVDIMSRIKESKGTSLNIVYTAPKESQINNLAPSIINSRTATTQQPFQLSNPEDRILEKITSGNMANVDVIIIDEATVFSGELTKVIDAVQKYNANSNNKPVKIVFAGDDLQQAKDGYLMNFMYDKVISSFFERTTPLTTPFRNGKIDSFDIQMNHREMISILTKLHLIAPGEGKFILIPGDDKPTEITSRDVKKEVYQKIVSTFTTAKETKYYSEKGIVKKGVKVVSDKVQVYIEFLKDVAERDTISDSEITFIVSPKEKGNILYMLKKTADELGIDVSHVDFNSIVIGSDESQGAEFDMVYTDIVLGESENTSAHFVNLKSLYVAESREKQGLVMVTDGFISSKPVSLETDIISFPDLKFDLKDDQDNLLPESAELVENNRQIQQLMEDLAGKKVALPEAIKNQKTMNTESKPEETKKETPPETQDTNDNLSQEGKEAAGGSVLTDEERLTKIMSMSTDEVRNSGKGFDFSKFCN